MNLFPPPDVKLRFLFQFMDSTTFAVCRETSLYTDFKLTSQRCLQIEELDVVRQLTLPERAVALALAVSLDSDYFSRRGGWYAYHISLFKMTCLDGFHGPLVCSLGFITYGCSGTY